MNVGLRYALHELGLLRGGTVYTYAHVHPRALADTLSAPVIASVRERTRVKVADKAGIDPALVAVIEFTPEHLADAQRRARAACWPDPVEAWRTDPRDDCGAYVALAMPRPTRTGAPTRDLP